MEKQRLLEAEAAANTPPPAYSDVELCIETVELVSTPPSLSGWIQSLPVTLPFVHVALSVPVTLWFATSLGEAVMLSSMVGFILVSFATAGVARATRDDLAAAKAAAGRLSAGIAVTVVWPLAVMLLITSSAGVRRHCTHAHRHHNHVGGATTLPTHHRMQPFVTTQEIPSPGSVGEVESSKGPRVLVATGDESVLGSVFDRIPTLSIAGGRIVIGSKGAKNVVADAVADADAVQPVEDESRDEQLR